MKIELFQQDTVLSKLDFNGYLDFFIDHDTIDHLSEIEFCCNYTIVHQFVLQLMKTLFV